MPAYDREERLRELALFAGSGGGLLGSLLCGWSVKCAVEINPRCRSIIHARQGDGALDRFPVWDDVRTFDGRPWRGKVDLVTGGFPCQPFSTAARGRHTAEDRWPDMLRIIREVEPQRVLAENVQPTPIERAALELRRLGYHCLVIRAPASSVGAPHRRVRYWVAADTDDSMHHVVEVHEAMASIRIDPGCVWEASTRPGDHVAHGVAGRLDRYEIAIGNGQVPHVVHAIGRLLGWTTENL